MGSHCINQTQTKPTSIEVVSIGVVRGGPFGLALLVAADVLFAVVVVVDKRVVQSVVVVVVAASLFLWPLPFPIFCSSLSWTVPSFPTHLIPILTLIKGRTKRHTVYPAFMVHRCKVIPNIYKVNFLWYMYITDLLVKVIRM